MSTETYRDGVKNPLSTEGGFKILRGGSWNSSADYLRSARRLGYSAWSRDDVGFRVCVTAVPRLKRANSSNPALSDIQER